MGWNHQPEKTFPCLLSLTELHFWYLMLVNYYNSDLQKKLRNVTDLYLTIHDRHDLTDFFWMMGLCELENYLETQTTIKKWMFGETTISYVKIGNHPIETTIYKWLFGVPGSCRDPRDTPLELGRWGNQPYSKSSQSQGCDFWTWIPDSPKCF